MRNKNMLEGITGSTSTQSTVNPFESDQLFLEPASAATVAQRQEEWSKIRWNQRGLFLSRPSYPKFHIIPRDRCYYYSNILCNLLIMYTIIGFVWNALMPVFRRSQKRVNRAYVDRRRLDVYLITAGWCVFSPALVSCCILYILIFLVIMNNTIYK